MTTIDGLYAGGALERLRLAGPRIAKAFADKRSAERCTRIVRVRLAPAVLPLC